MISNWQIMTYINDKMKILNWPNDNVKYQPNESRNKWRKW